MINYIFAFSVAEKKGISKSIIEEFLGNVSLFSSKDAVIHNNETITYKELNVLSDRIASFLSQKGIEKGNKVAIVLHRKILAYATILAIIKLNAIYVPMNPEDLAYAKKIVEEIKPEMIIVENDLYKEFSNCTSLVWNIDDRSYENIKKSEYVTSNNKSIAYICFTSGSTGKPKGVMVLQEGIVSLVKYADYMEFKNDDVITQNSPMEFDAFTFEFWGVLLNGATLVCVDKSALLTVNQFKRLIDKNKVNKMFLTTSLFNNMSKYNPQIFENIEIVVAGGDVMDVSGVKRLLTENDRIRIVNGYGPTENTTFSTTYTVTCKSMPIETIPIGKPLINDVTYILDDNMKLLPYGETGNIYVGGVGLASGYLNMTELTEKMFVDNPFDVKSKLYDTGDIGYWDENGNVIFVGRRDEQVKVSGYRIELKMIKQMAETLECINNCEVIVYKHDDIKEIILFYVSNVQVTPDVLANELSILLPAYMMPDDYVRVAEIPYNTSDKVNKFELNNIYREKRDSKLTKKVGCTLEQFINKYAIKDIDETMNFFEAGLSSLKLMMLLEELNREYQLDLAITDLFEYFNLKLLNAYINKLLKSKR